MAERRANGVLRQLAFALERTMVEEASSGAMKGAAGALQEQLPELQATIRSLAQELVHAMATAVGERLESDPLSVELPHTMAASALRGAIAELVHETKDPDAPLGVVLSRLDSFLSDAVGLMGTQTRHLESAAERAKQLARELVSDVLDQVRESLKELTPSVEEATERARKLAAQAMSAESRERALKLARDAGEALGQGLAAGMYDALVGRAVGSVRRHGRSLLAGAGALGAAAFGWVFLARRARA